MKKMNFSMPKHCCVSPIRMIPMW